uniref:Endoplasmic reticulum transmembrane protein n=1 Tax=Opuntia streptacantha TaxID=393608 RepID=A0A7C9CNY5_OPUST
MIQLLFMVIFAEAAVVMLLLFNSPLRRLLLSALDGMKRGRGPIIVKTISGTIFVVLSSGVYNSVMIQRRGKSDEAADLSPTDQVLFAKHLLESSLMGFILFLTLMIDRLHYYIRELSMRRKTMELDARKKNNAIEEDARAREQQVETFKELIKQLETELEDKIKEAHASEANVEALRKQCEGLLSEYDRLLGENQKLKDQLRTVDQMYSHSATKKDS